MSENSPNDQQHTRPNYLEGFEHRYNFTTEQNETINHIEFPTGYPPFVCGACHENLKLYSLQLKESGFTINTYQCPQCKCKMEVHCLKSQYLLEYAEYLKWKYNKEYKKMAEESTDQTAPPKSKKPSGLDTILKKGANV
jgi:hypothetical protein